MIIVSATGAERLSLGYQPVTETGAALFLSFGAPGFPPVPAHARVEGRSLFLRGLNQT